MKKIGFMLLMLLMITSCGNEDGNETEQKTEGQEKPEEIQTLDVDFQVPDKADVGETIELKATVTYGDEQVTDANDVKIEYWKQGHEDDSTMVEANHVGEGIYASKVTFEEDGVYEMYAHTTARDLHTMPKKSISVGEGAQNEEDHEAEGHDHSEQDEGVAIHFDAPDTINADESVELIAHVENDGEGLKGANVRYEIVDTDWVDTEETAAGEYTGSYSFKEVGSYTVVIHVENDEGIHEHTEREIEIGS
ncbi:FixH family protein [Salinibacillus xinjiangensis]|uniref:YtkA-like domain-containing protein n=1 Tax=Salinibacillus xinjiangensis TaxID=1229268 RepID=A0A6G1XAX1_9BACI|nr:FixH family protein [Salinibacillus xinjiangensis]MRG88087.1 hypothetical protein [Salinibacillus xinjiangensis]